MTSGLKARLQASFESDLGRSRTRISTQAPLDLRGPLHTRSGRELYYLRNSTAGILSGDDFEIDVVVSGTDLQIASPSSSKVFEMDACSRSQVRLEVADGANLVWGPHALILQQGADYRQELSVVLNGGTVVLADVLVLGRLAGGEVRRFRRLESHLEVRNAEGCPLYEEHFVLCPATDEGLSASLGGFGAVASVHALGIPAGVATAAAEIIAGQSAGFSGASLLPNGAGLVARMLAGSLSEGFSFCETALAALQA